MIEIIKKLVRPLMAFGFVGTVIYLAIKGKIPPKEVLTITAIIVAFYFGERAALKRPGEGDAPPPSAS